jgi:hypothetical protein
VSIVKHGKVMEFTHVHVPDVFPIELTVYPPNELRNRPRSSTDGKPIVRVGERALRKVCEIEHAELWQRYLADGSTPSVEDILAAEDADEAPACLEVLDETFDELRASDAGLAEADDAAEEVQDPQDDDEEEREPRIRRLPRDGPRGARRRYVHQARAPGRCASRVIRGDS